MPSIRMSPALGCSTPEHHVDGGGLAGAVGSQQADDLPGAHAEGDAVDGDRSAVVLTQAVDLQRVARCRSGRHRPAHAPRGWRPMTAAAALMRLAARMWVFHREGLHVAGAAGPARRCGRRRRRRGRRRRCRRGRSVSVGAGGYGSDEAPRRFRMSGHLVAGDHRGGRRPHRCRRRDWPLRSKATTVPSSATPANRPRERE